METFSTSIHWFDIRPSDLKEKSFEDLSEQYRSDQVAGLVTHLESLGGTVIILLSPIGFAFTQRSTDFVLATHGYYTPFDWGNDPELVRAYAKELRKAGIRKADPQARLFGNFNNKFGWQSGGIPSLSVSKRYLESYRLDSYGFERRYEPQIQHHFERMFDQLGQWAFEPFPEVLPIEELSPRHESFDHYLMTWRDLSSEMFINKGFDEVKSDALVEKILTELRRSVDRLQSGLAFDIPEAPINRIRRPIFFTYNTGYERPLTAEVFSYRSRLVHLLACPGYFHAVEKQLPQLRETWPVLSAGKSLPYNPIEELEAYLAEMLERYPVLGEDPFSPEDLAAASAPAPAAPAAAAPASPAVTLDKALLAKLSSRAIALKPRPRKKTFPPGASRFGGLPDLPATLAWPSGNHGPLGFLAQINCREAARFDAQKLLPSKGMLYFFYDLAEQPWGDSTEELADAVVLYAPDDTGLTQAGLPAGLDEDEGILPTVALGFGEELTLEDHSRETLAAMGLDEAQINAYFELYDERSVETSNSESPKHRLLGLPDQVQNPMPPDCVALRGGTNDDWRLLLQLDSDETLDTLWGDMGRLYFWIRADDLKRAHFAETCTFLQCH